MRRLFLVSLMVFIYTGIFLPVALYAEDVKTEQQLEEISITATRLERKTEEVPASVAIVGEDRLEDTKMFNLKEALIGTPGVLIDTRNQGYDSRLIIRGSGLKARYGVREIMVLLNGVPITDPDSLTRLDFVDTQLIERVEVVKGPNSTLWGANAAGGVINIITKGPFKRKGGTVKIGAGDFNTQLYHFSYSDSVGENFFISLSGSRRQSDNSWRRWNKFWTNQISIQPSFIFDDGTTVENFLSYTKASLQLPGSLSEEQFEKYLRTGRARETFGPWQYSGRYSESLFFSSKLTREIGNFEIKPMIFINKWRHHHPVTGRINNADTMTYGTDIQINQRHTLWNMKGTLTTGFTIRYDDQDTDYFKYAEYATGYRGRITEVLSDDVGEKIERQKRKTLLWGIYMQESIRPSSRWIVDIGVRFDKVKFEISGTKKADYDWSSGTYLDCPDSRLTNCGDYSIEKTYDAFSPRIGITYKLTEKIHIYGNISTGIQTPTEGEISENPDLELVKVSNYEVGVKARYSKWMFDSAIYYSPVKDEIVRVIQEDGTTDYINAGRTKKKGFEFSGSYLLTGSWKVGVTYSYSDYKFEEFTEPVRVGRTTVNMDRSGNRLPYVPKHQYSLFTSYKHPSGLKLSIQTNTWGPYYMDNANSERYKGYSFVTNAMVGYEKGNFDIALVMDNIFDKRYAVQVTKDTRGVKRYTPAAPKSFIIRATYRF